MRVLQFALAAGVCFGFVHASGVRASDNANAITALELQLSSLLERGAFDEYERHLAPDYELTTADGELLSRDQALGWWRARGPGLKLTPSQMHVRFYRDTAILTARVTGDKNGPDRVTKTFVRIDGRWFLAALHASHIARQGR